MTGIIIEPNYGDLTTDTVIVTVNVNIAGYKEAISNYRQIESGIKISSNGFDNFPGGKYFSHDVFSYA